jgi:hypothetical protein
MIFLLGLISGGWLFGILGFVVGRIIGYDDGLNHVAALLKVDEAHGDVPTPPYDYYYYSDDADWRG